MLFETVLVIAMTIAAIGGVLLFVLRRNARETPKLIESITQSPRPLSLHTSSADATPFGEMDAQTAARLYGGTDGALDKKIPESNGLSGRASSVLTVNEAGKKARAPIRNMLDSQDGPADIDAMVRSPLYPVRLRAVVADELDEDETFLELSTNECEGTLLLSLGMRELFEAQEDEGDAEWHVLPSGAAGYGSMGVRSASDLRGFIAALCAHLGIAMPPVEAEHFKGEAQNLPWKHHGQIKRAGERYAVISFALNVLDLLSLYLVVSPDLKRGEVFIGGGGAQWRVTMFSLARRFFGGEDQRPERAHDAALISDEPLVRTLRPFGRGHDIQEVHRTLDGSIFGASYVPEGDERCDLTLLKWGRVGESPKKINVLRDALVSSVSLSPDGERVAVLLSSSPDEQEHADLVVYVCPEGRTPRELGRMRIEDLSHTSMSWSPDGSELAVLQQRASSQGEALKIIDATGSVRLSRRCEADDLIGWTQEGLLLMSGGACEHDVYERLHALPDDRYADPEPLSGLRAPKGGYEQRVGDYGWAFFSEGQEIATRRFTSVDAMSAMSCWDCFGSPHWLAAHLFLVNERPYELIDARTGRAALLLSEEEEADTYTVAPFLHEEGGVQYLFFYGSEGWSYGELTLPEELR